jgi:hypothetical protein
MLSGVLLVGIGILHASGQLTLFTQLASGNDLSIWVVELEERLRPLFGLK